MGDAEGGERRHPERLGDDGVRERHRGAVGERRLAAVASDHLTKSKKLIGVPVVTVMDGEGCLNQFIATMFSF